MFCDSKYKRLSTGRFCWWPSAAIPVPHPSLKAGDVCPSCGEGIVYAKPPGVVVRIIGQRMGERSLAMPYACKFSPDFHWLLYDDEDLEKNEKGLYLAPVESVE